MTSDIERRFADALQAKDQGTEQLKLGNIKRASFLYKSVYLHIGDLVSKTLTEGIGASSSSSGPDFASMFAGKSRKTMDEATQAAIDDLYAASLNNLALTHVKLGRFVEAIDCASRVLRHTPDNDKALFRRAKGRIHLGMLSEAEEDLNSILRRKPDDQDTLALMQDIKGLLVKSAAKEKKMYQRMFASGDSDGSSQ